ncbi:MAG: ORF6N domain-containing protein [Campylobacterales bacterium]|nr:ORF6N domain-containing protein [Campylobacterales bacterium]
MNEVTASIDDNIKNKIYTIRGLQVVLDRDLAELYGVETKVFNQAVKRNEDRFPSDFRFQLTVIEKNELVTNCDRLNSLKHSTVNPYVFTEQGVSMLSAVLRSDIAVEISVKIMRTFIQMRQVIASNSELFSKIEQIEKRQITYESKSDERFEKIFSAIEDKSIKPKQGIFYDGQVYDAYIFVSDLIKSADESIVLIDNYIDDTVLTLLSKREAKVKTTIYTKNITKQLELDLQKHNAQYPNIELKKFDSSHDRFLIIDGKEVYHIGASLKDLGKKWFAFSKFDVGSLDIIGRLK